jgi:hypothetical protein
MTATTLSPVDDRPTSSVTAAAPVADNRPIYLAWGSAWAVGYGAMALDSGPTPVLDLPSLVAPALLGLGLLGAAVVTGIATGRNQRGVTGPAKVAGTMVGAAWLTGFTALFLLITGLGRVLGDDHLQTVMWPAGSALVVGLLYLAGGAGARDVVQYALGTWLAVIGTAAVFLDTPGLYVVLAVAGAVGYAVAAALEPRRVAAARVTAA